MFQIYFKTNRRTNPINVSLVPPPNKDCVALESFWQWLSEDIKVAETSSSEEQEQVT